MATLKLHGEKTDISKTISSNDIGYYEFADLREDTYTIVVTKSGYRKVTRKIVMKAGEEKKIKIMVKKKI
ncbi:MAG: carboxypeptidase-like regulatory domain-containing protein [Candidatus Jettenia sp.]|nr:MAG: carboxypeptidase-like regulatory domain-containing protein [Candidatus Jettenia sp.]